MVDGSDVQTGLQAPKTCLYFSCEVVEAPYLVFSKAFLEYRIGPCGDQLSFHTALQSNGVASSWSGTNAYKGVFRI